MCVFDLMCNDSIINFSFSQEAALAMAVLPTSVHDVQTQVMNNFSSFVKILVHLKLQKCLTFVYASRVLYKLDPGKFVYGL